MAIDTDVSHTLRPLINGITEKPAVDKLDSQCVEQINWTSHPSHGLVRRPPTEYRGVATQGATELGYRFFHLIEGTAGEKFLMVIADSSCRVWDIADGTEATVTNVASAFNYLNDPDPNSTARQTYKRFAANTTLDTTIVTNRTTIPAMAATLSPDRPNQLLIYCKKIQALTNYNIKIEARGSTPYDFLASVKSAGLGLDDTGDQIGAIKTILDNFVAGIPGPETLNWPSTGAHGLFKEGSVLWGTQDKSVTNTWSDGMDRVEASDGVGNTGIYAWNEKVAAFKDLPAQGPDGFVMEITGEDASQFDNYWVVYEKFDVDDDTPVNRWRETIKPNIKTSLNPTTMPHRLVQTGSGPATFDFEAIPWADRLVGDEDSAPEPSFVGSAIRDLTMYDGRLFFVAGESLIGSEVGEFWNFFPTTVSTVVDSDPVDVAGTTDFTAVWDWITPYNETLILHSSAASLQSRYGAKNQTTTPATKPPAPVSRYPQSAFVRPVVIDNKLYTISYGDDLPGPSDGVVNIHELFVDENDNVQGNPLMLDNPNLMSRDILYATGETSPDSLIVGGDSRGPYVYTFTESGGERLQSGWSKWGIGSRINDLGNRQQEAVTWVGRLEETQVLVSNGDILVVDHAKRQTSSHVGYRDDGSSFPILIHLDRQEEIVGVYDAGTDTTTFTLSQYVSIDPSSSYKPSDWVALRSNGETIANVVYTDASHIVTVIGDYSEAVIFGVRYHSRWEPGELSMPDGRGTGRSAGHLTVKRGGLFVKDSGPLDVFITFTDSPNDEFLHQMPQIELKGAIDLDDITQLNRLASRKFDFDCGGGSRVTRIAVQADSHLPSTVHAMEWVGRYYARARQA